MIKVWVISDTHLSHGTIIFYRHRPFKNAIEMDEKIIENWNRVVGPNDIVIHLGDFGPTSKSRLKSLRNRLNGVIILIAGSHDKIPVVTKNRFIVVTGSIKINNLIFTHEPMMEVPENMVNVHGHIHSTGTYGRRINACVEWTDYTPVPLEYYLKEAKQILQIEK
jgi:calcineurin-like phosphoesterase family protein